MAFQVSPGVEIREFDLTAIIPAISTTPAGYVGVFQWGPADQRVLVNSEKQLESIFFRPLKDAYYATSWLMASNFLAYGGNLQVVRSVSDNTAVDLINGNDANSLSYRSYPSTVPTPGSGPIDETDYQEETGGGGNDPETGEQEPTSLVYGGPTVGCIYANGVNAGQRVAASDTRYVAPRTVYKSLGSIMKFDTTQHKATFLSTLAAFANPDTTDFTNFSITTTANFDYSTYNCQTLQTSERILNISSALFGAGIAGQGTIYSNVGWFSPSTYNVDTAVDLYLDCNCDGVEDTFNLLPALTSETINDLLTKGRCVCDPTAACYSPTLYPDGCVVDIPTCTSDWPLYGKSNSTNGAPEALAAFFAANQNYKPFFAQIQATIYHSSVSGNTEVPYGLLPTQLQMLVNADSEVSNFIEPVGTQILLDELEGQINNGASFDELWQNYSKYIVDSDNSSLKTDVENLYNTGTVNAAKALLFSGVLLSSANLFAELVRQAIQIEQQLGSDAILTPEAYDHESYLTQIKNRNDFEDKLYSGQLQESTFYAKYPGTYLNGVGVAIYGYGFTGEYTTTDTNRIISDGVYPQWAKNAYRLFSNDPTTTQQAESLGFIGDEVHVAVVDVTGNITGVEGQVIEFYEGLSVASDAKRPDGSGNYWKDVINNKSQYIWVASDVDLVFKTTTGLEWGSPFNNPSSNYTTKLFKRLHGSVPTSGSSILYLTFGKLAGERGQFTSADPALSSRILNQYKTSFGDADESDISLLIGYDTIYEYDLNEFVQIAQNRKDAIAFVSACYDKNLISGSRQNILDAILEFSDNMSSTSYGVMDSGYKYQYDRFNNVYRYIPLCADVAGCCVRTDNQRDPWWSPAGYDRGRILNTVKLTFNPNKAERDLLYQKNVNPVITSQGFGIILFGDKTMQKKASAFDRINVRRLFNVVEKSIATAAKFSLFEFNDAFTRAQFKQLIEPFLRDVQGRRGLTSYAVVCDESNNPPSIIDSNRFVADIFIAPNRSINFIQLNFIATPTGVTFAEYGG